MRSAGKRKWPIKPDICFEGGNVLTDGALRRYFTEGEVARMLRPVIAPEVFAPLD